MARLALVTRAPPRLAPPPRRECALPDPCIPRVGRPEIQVTGFSTQISRQILLGRIDRSTRVALTLTYAPPLSLVVHSRSGKAGYVYKLGLRNGKANVDEYSPIYTPSEFKTDGDKYEGDLKLAAGAVLGVIGTGALAILATSAL